MFKSILERGLDNLKFALNLDGGIPEHGMNELRSRKEFTYGDKEDLVDFDKFSFSLEQISSESRAKSNLKPPYIGHQKYLLFEDIIGYDDLKELLSKCLTVKDSCNVLLSGPPASSKTIFLLSIQKEALNVCFIDATNSSGPGLVDYLFEHPDTQVICIDEIDKLKKNDQYSLLSLLESGILSCTKAGKTRSIGLKGVKVFATANDVGCLVGPLKSRFLTLELPEYTWESFLEVTRKLLHKRHDLDEIVSTKVARVVWSTMQTRDLRDVLAIGKLAKNTEDVEFIATTLQKYRWREKKDTEVRMFNE
jgi:replication-associated recombination protein RarA